MLRFSHLKFLMNFLLRSILGTLLLLASVRAVGVAPKQIKNFVTFGDSYVRLLRLFAFDIFSHKSASDWHRKRRWRRSGLACKGFLPYEKKVHCELLSLLGLCSGVCGPIAFPICKVWGYLLEQSDRSTFPFGLRKPVADLLCRSSQSYVVTQSRRNDLYIMDRDKRCWSERPTHR